MYNNLIANINQYITENGNNEITGPVLNSVLVQMLNALGSGMNFYGIANSRTVPVNDEYPKFYIALTPGSYTNFNLSGQVAFTSGFAVLYDEAGNNTWQIAVKSMSELGTGTFLVDAQIKDNVYASTDVLYIKEASRTNSGSSFSLYKTDELGTNETLVSIFTKPETLSGYHTHKIIDSNGETEYIIAVDWDDIPENVPTTFTPADTKFPKTAYVELYEVEPSVSNSKFIVDAAVVNNTYTPNIVFYIKRAVRHSSSSTFQVYKLDQITGDEELAARAFVSGALASGYGTYKVPDVTTQNTLLKIYVNWDDIPEASTAIDFTEFAYSDTKFPKTAYTTENIVTDETILSRRLDLVEAMNNYKVTHDPSNAKLIITRDDIRYAECGWVGPGTDVEISGILKTEIELSYSSSRSGSHELQYAWGAYLREVSGDFTRPLRLTIALEKVVLAPRYTEIMLTNTSSTAYNIEIKQKDQGGVVQVIRTIEFSGRSVMFLRLTRFGDKIYVNHQLFSRDTA